MLVLNFAANYKLAIVATSLSLSVLYVLLEIGTYVAPWYSYIGFMDKIDVTMLSFVDNYVCSQLAATIVWFLYKQVYSDNHNYIE